MPILTPTTPCRGCPRSTWTPAWVFERVCGILQCTDSFKDFTRHDFNYESDVFTPIFRELENLSNKKYTSTLPSDASGSGGASVPACAPRRGMDADQVKTDIAFRVIADHIRCLSFAIADGILPSNERVAATCCAASCAALCVTDATSVSMNPSSSSWSMSSPRTSAACSRSAEAAGEDQSNAQG